MIENIIPRLQLLTQGRLRYSTLFYVLRQNVEPVITAINDTTIKEDIE